MKPPSKPPVTPFEIEGAQQDRIPKFAEFQVRLKGDDDPNGIIELEAWVRIGAAVIDREGRVFEVRAKKAIVGFSLSGLKGTFEKRFGEQALEREERVRRSTEQVIEGKAKAGAKAGLSLSVAGPLPSAAVQGELSGEARFKTKTTHKDEVVTQRVITLPGHEWELREPNGPYLQGPYFQGDRLCRLRRVSGANQIAVSGYVLVLERDLVFLPEKESLFGMRDHTRDALLKMFVAKHMQGADRALRGLCSPLISRD